MREQKTMITSWPCWLSTTTDIGQRTVVGETSGMTGPRSVASSSWETHLPEVTNMELATSWGCSVGRTVSPNSQTIRPSLSRPLAPISPACHAGQVHGGADGVDLFDGRS